MSKGPGKLYRIRSDPLEKAASRRWVETTGGEKMPISSGFGVHIRAVADALPDGQGVCAHNSGRNPPLAPLAFCSDNQ